MKNMMKKLIFILGVSIFMAGTVSAASPDCGDDSAKPIKIQSSTNKTNNNV